MAVLNVMTFVVLFAVTVHSVPVQVNNEFPTESESIIDIPNIVRDSLFKIKSFKVEEEKIKMIADGAFDSFTKFAENRLSALIKQANKTSTENEATSEELLALKLGLMKWFENLERLNNMSDVSEKMADKALEKFVITIDFIVNEGPKFNENFSVQSVEALEIMEKIALGFKESAFKILGLVKSIEDQVSGISKSN